MKSFLCILDIVDPMRDLRKRKTRITLVIDMPKQFANVTELENWVKSNKDLGKINGKYPFNTNRVEIRGVFVYPELYNRLLIISKTMGYSKSDTGRSAIEMYNRICTKGYYSHPPSYYFDKLAQIPIDSFTKEFRFHLPMELIGKKEPLNVPNKNTVCMALIMWADTYEVHANKKLKEKSKELGVSIDELENAIFQQCLYESRVKRLKRSQSLGYLVKDTKM